MKGTVQVVDIPDEEQLREMTEQVVSNNFHLSVMMTRFLKKSGKPRPFVPGEKESPIRHIVFISKENRTYDEVFGQIEKDKVTQLLPGMASMRLPFRIRKIRNPFLTPRLCPIIWPLLTSSPFQITSMDSDVSADYHRWLVNTYPNEW